MGNFGLMDIVRAHSELGITATPDTITATLYAVEGEPSTWFNGIASDWYLVEGTILGAPVWGFTDDIDTKIVFAPHMFVTEGRTYTKTRDETRENGLVRGLPVRELEYQLVRTEN